MPCPPRRSASTADAAPRPSSTTSIRTASASWRMVTVAVAFTPAWRITLVSASCTMRYAATSTAAGTAAGRASQSTVIATPALRAFSISVSTWSSPGVGASGTSSSSRQHTDGRPQLVERLLAELLDRRERRTGLFRMAIEHVQRGPGLHVDRGDAVGDHVVEVAGDAEALLGDAAPGFLLAGLLQVLRALLELGEVGPPAEVGRAEEHRPADPARRRRGSRRSSGPGSR